MELEQALRSVELLEGLTESEIKKVAEICTERQYPRGEKIIKQGEWGDEMYIITQGFVEVSLDETKQAPPKVVVNLGPGQITGEMALLDQGPRSATVKALSEPTIVQVIKREGFETLCQEDANIGYKVMRNLAMDLSFKLRHRNIIER